MGMTCDGCANAARRVLGKLGDKVTIDKIDLADLYILSRLNSGDLRTQEVVSPFLRYSLPEGGWPYTASNAQAWHPEKSPIGALRAGR
ncbi:unnamed protein product [Strongylus vulgaris]|uniref:Uncharacterized protein n=1 Tax=Strongylus vulgaris TaxID=40348 RepID=A0A3P7JJ05_STRVU|nr:unnamed protein product [Strongylus vulgaris]